MFGTSHLYVFHHPSHAKTSPIKIDDITYEMAQEEIAKNLGVMDNFGLFGPHQHGLASTQAPPEGK